MATHARILAWKIPWTEEPCGLQRVQKVTELDTTDWLSTAQWIVTDSSKSFFKIFFKKKDLFSPVSFS